MIVVTGAAGFIGSNIVADLEERDAGPIAVVDWFGGDERWRNLAKRRIDAFIRPEALDDWLSINGGDVTAIIHMGAISSTTERDVDKLVANNINFTVNLWDWCAQRQIPFVYASSAATYGGIEDGFVDADTPAALARLRPLNAYGWSKHSTDMIFARRIASGKPAPPQWVGLKFFNVYGPNEHHKGDQMSVACKLFSQIRAGQRVRLFKSYREGIADGDQRRDFVYVKDCTRAIIWFLENPSVSGLYNIGTGKARSFLDIAQALGRAMNTSVDVEFIEMPESIRDRYQYFTQADLTKLRARGVGTPFVSLEEGITNYVSQHLAREDSYR